jgi:hypothetical protein
MQDQLILQRQAEGLVFRVFNYFIHKVDKGGMVHSVASLQEHC